MHGGRVPNIADKMLAAPSAMGAHTLLLELASELAETSLVAAARSHMDYANRQPCLHMASLHLERLYAK